MRESDPLRTRALRRRWVLLAALPAGLVAAELLVRALGLEAAPLPSTEGTTFRPVDDAVQRFENRPGAVQVVRSRQRSDGPEHVVEMRVNADGFRGPRVPKVKRAGTTRIACLGDSHTFGYGVADDATWPAHLSETIRSLRPEAAVEVVNAGVNAYDTPQELLHLKRRVLPLDPDVVILQFYVNDPAVRGAGGGASDALVELTHPRRGGRIAALRRCSRLLDVVFDRVHRRRSLSVYAEERLGLYAPESEGWRAVTEALREMRDVLDARGVAFGVALFPFLVRQSDALTSHDAFERVKAFLEEARIPCLDPEPAFLAADVDRLRISDQDYHANEEGYRIFAREVAAWAEACGWIR